MNKQFDAVAIQIEKKQVTLEELISRGMELRSKGDNIVWELGDLASEVTRQFGPKELRIFSQHIGVKIATLRRYRDVSRAYTIEQREEFALLPWSAFRQIAANPDRVAILRRAHDENWSVEKLMMMTQEDQRKVIDDGQIVPPRPEMEFCLGCRKWYIGDETLVCQSKGQCPDLNK